MTRFPLNRETFVTVLTGPGLLQFDGTVQVRVNSTEDDAPWFTFQRGDKWDVPTDLVITARAGATGDSVTAVQYSAATSG